MAVVSPRLRARNRPFILSNGSVVWLAGCVLIDAHLEYPEEASGCVKCVVSLRETVRNFLPTQRRPAAKPELREEGTEHHYARTLCIQCRDANRKVEPCEVASGLAAFRPDVLNRRAGIAHRFGGEGRAISIHTNLFFGAPSLFFLSAPISAIDHVWPAAQCHPFDSTCRSFARLMGFTLCWTGGDNEKAPQLFAGLRFAIFYEKYLERWCGRGDSAFLVGLSQRKSTQSSNTRINTGLQHLSIRSIHSSKSLSSPTEIDTK